MHIILNSLSHASFFHVHTQQVQQTGCECIRIHENRLLPTSARCGKYNNFVTVHR